MSQTSITEAVSSNMEISIISTSPEFNLEDPIWAINWFDLKSKWLYDFYNLLAFPHVNAVGARPFFKGRLIKKLEGELHHQREMLLIVNYPSPSGFLSMLKSTVFQLKSIVRVLSVKVFNFGFMRRLDDGEAPSQNPNKYLGKLVYLIHHMSGEIQQSALTDLKEYAVSYDIFTHFIGVKSHLIGRREPNDKLKTAPFHMDCLVVLGAFEEEQFHSLINSPFYQELLKSSKSNYLGLYSREL